jgi:hypothetical protein
MNITGPAYYSGVASTNTAAQGFSSSMQSFEPTTEGTIQSICLLQGFELGANSTVLETLATNANTPVSILRKLAYHSEPDIRAALVENRSTPLETIYQLANDQDPDVRYQLAENHHLPIDMLQHLSEDDNPYVACRAQRTIARLEQINSAKRIGWSAFRRTNAKNCGNGVNELSQSGNSVVLFVSRLCDCISRYARAT